jgi:ribosome-associated protein
MSEQDDELISKSQRKRECDAMQKLGEDLIKLKLSELEDLELNDALFAAIMEARKLQSRSALKRQRQYIGKLMRETNSSLIEKKLAAIQHRHDFSTARFRQTEHWRDRLLEGDNSAVTELIDAYPDTDRQLINQLVRQSRKEHEHNKPPASSRKLFKYLMELNEQHAVGNILHTKDNG